MSSSQILVTAVHKHDLRFAARALEERDKIKGPAQPIIVPQGIAPLKNTGIVVLVAGALNLPDHSSR